MLQGFKQLLAVRGNFVLARLANNWLLISFSELSTPADGRDEVTNPFSGSVAQALCLFQSVRKENC